MKFCCKMRLLILASACFAVMSVSAADLINGGPRKPPPSPSRQRKPPPSPAPLLAPPMVPIISCNRSSPCPSTLQSCIRNTCVETGYLRFTLSWEGGVDVDVWFTTPTLAYGGSNNPGTLVEVPAELPTFQTYPGRGVVNLHYDSILAPLGVFHVCALLPHTSASLAVTLNAFSLSGYQFAEGSESALVTNKTWGPKVVSAATNRSELCDPFHPGYVASIKLCQWGSCSSPCRFYDSCGVGQVCYYKTDECTDACGAKVCSASQVCSTAIPGARPVCVKRLSPPPSPPGPPGTARCGTTWACSKSTQSCVKSTCVTDGQLRLTLTWPGPKAGVVDWTPLALIFTDPNFEPWLPYDPSTNPKTGNLSVEVDDKKGGVYSIVWRSEPIPGPYHICATGAFGEIFEDVNLLAKGRLGGTVVKTASWTLKNMNASSDYLCHPYHPGYLATIEVCSSNRCGATCLGAQCAPGDFCYGHAGKVCATACGGYTFCPANRVCNVPKDRTKLPTCSKA